MNKEELIVELKSEGFPYVYEWKDEPDTEYKTHSHKGKVSFYVLDGSITLNIDGIHTTFRKGDRFDAPIGIPHSAKVGTDGCEYVVGEEFEDDSQ